MFAASTRASRNRSARLDVSGGCGGIWQTRCVQVALGESPWGFESLQPHYKPWARQEGLGARRIAARTGLPISTVRDWLVGTLPRHARPAATSDCSACGQPEHRFAQLPAEYCYLLGLHLGDGCISTGPRGVYRLRVNLDLAYPGIVDECEAAIRAVAPRNRVHRLLRRSNYTRRPEPSLVEVSAYSRAWPCLFP